MKKKPDSNLNGLYKELAGRFGSLSKFYGEFNSPKAVKELLDSLTLADAAKPFPEIVDLLDFPMAGKCGWLRDQIEHVVTTFTGFVEECKVRDNLTPDEVTKYWEIYSRYWAEGSKTSIDERGVVKKGAFLNALKASGLVNCDIVPKYDTSVTIVFGPPEKVCV